MSSEVAKRGRGRPKGSKNINKLFSGATVAAICEYNKFNPTLFLLQVAKGLESTEQWTKDDRLRAATKLHDSIHHNKALNGGEQDAIDGQFEIVFIEASEDFTLPGETHAEGSTDIVSEQSLQCISDTPPSW
jgi:hypothetical protein